MNRARVIAASAIALVAGAIQLYPVVERDNPPTSSEMTVPEEAHRILRRACYDCHSNETRWPWYSYVAPASWLVVRDVQTGRQHLNFSTWPETPPPGAECFFKQRIVDQVESGDMPPPPYRMLHASGTLTAEDRSLNQRWAASGCGEP